MRQCAQKHGKLYSIESQFINQLSLWQSIQDTTAQIKESVHDMKNDKLEVVGGKIWGDFCVDNFCAVNDSSCHVCFICG